uniref:BACK domain-containing protein n=1 Tax=Rhabditophanes sp. KR3021 TaxID=114890 RepID=A0AC35TH55_9BILA
MRLRNVTNLYEGNPFASCNLCFIDGSMKVSKVVLAIDNDYFHKLFLTNIEQSLITRWIEHDYDGRKSGWLELAMTINFGMFSSQFILNYLSSNPQICEIPELVKFLISRIEDVENIRVLSGRNRNLWGTYLFGGSCNKTNVFKIREENVQKIGKYAFILGGFDNRIERFDLETCESSILSLKIIGETYYLSSSAIGSQTYVIGGSVCDQSVDTIRCLDSEKMKWMDKPNLLKDMVGHDSIVIDGVIYVTTGNDSASLQRFDPRESKWNILKDIPSGNGTCAVTIFGKISPALDH